MKRGVAASFWGGVPKIISELKVQSALSWE